jgi:hypothetical protein
MPKNEGFGVGNAHREPGLGYLKVGGPDYPDLMMRSLRLKGQLPELILPAMQVGFTLEDFTRPEYWWLRRGTRWYTGSSVGAVAAQVGFGQLVVPNNRIAIVESFVAGAVPATRFSFRNGGGLAGGANISINGADSRNSQVSAPESFAIGTNVAGILQGDFIMQAGANGIVSLPFPMIVVGPFILSVIAGTVNQAIDVAISWRSRELQPEEL